MPGGEKKTCLLPDQHFSVLRQRLRKQLRLCKHIALAETSIAACLTLNPALEPKEQSLYMLGQT